QGIPAGDAQGAESPVRARASLRKISGESCSALLPRSMPSRARAVFTASAARFGPRTPEARLLRMVFRLEENRARQSAESTDRVAVSGASSLGLISTTEETTSGTG